MAYCSKACQLKDWKAGHKPICKAIRKDLEETITLEEPGPMQITAMSNRHGGESHVGGSFRKPDDVAVNEQFYVKIQAGKSSLLIYDRSRQCQFCYMATQHGFQTLLEKVRQDPSANGLKTYMAASFDESGKFKLYVNKTTVKLW